jgi:hypothetical protein
MALGGLQVGAKYFHGVWEQFAKTSGRFQNIKIVIFCRIISFLVEASSCVFKIGKLFQADRMDREKILGCL